MTTKNFFLKWINKKILLLILISITLFIVVLIFFRWTGWIYNTPLSWKRPEVNLISDENSDPVILKNNEIWVNINYNEHHSRVHEAVIWIDDDYNNRQTLNEGADVYVFENLSNGQHQLHYSLEWSLFGDVTVDSNFFVIEGASTIYFDRDSDIYRTNEEMSITLTVEGEFYETESGETTLGLYYFDFNYFKYMINNSEDSIIDIFLDSLIKQDIVLKEGRNTYYIDSIKTATDVIYLSEYSYENFILIPGGIIEKEDKFYLVLGPIFQAYYFAKPVIYSDNIETYVNQEGTLIITNIYYNNENFDNLHESFLECAVYNEQNEEVAQTYVSINYDSSMIDDIVFEELFVGEGFETPTNFNDDIEYTIKLQIKCGYESITDYEPGFDNSLWYSDIVVIDGSVSSFVVNPEFENIEYSIPNYFLTYDNEKEFVGFFIDWNSASFSEEVDDRYYFNVYWKWETDQYQQTDWYLIDKFQNSQSSDLTSGIDFVLIDDLLVRDEDLYNAYNNNDIIRIELYFEILVPEYDWWGNPTNNYIGTELKTNYKFIIEFSKNP